MAEFGAQATSVNPIQNNVRPVEGVAQPNSLIPIASTLFDQAGKIFEDEKAKRAERSISDFTSRQTLVMDALDQGRIKTAAQARTMMRSNFLDAIQATPGLREELSKAQSDLVGLFGDSSLLSQGTIEEQRRNDRADQLVSAGALAVDHTEEQFQEAANAAQLAYSAQQIFDERMDTINLALKSDDLSDSRRAALKAEQEQAASTYLRDRAPLEVETLRTTFDSIVNSNIPEAEKVKAIQDQMISWRSRANSLVSDLEQGEFNAYLKPFEMIEEVYLSRARGELDDAAVKRDIERINNLSTRTALLDPVIADLATASRLFDTNMFDQVLINNDKAFNAMAKFLAGGQTAPDGTTSEVPSPFVPAGSEAKGLNGYLDGVLRGLDSPDAETRQESTARVQQFLESIEDYEGQIRRNPEKGIALVNWMSSPAFLRAVNSNPELFTDTSAVGSVLTEHYADEVWGMIQNEFRNSNVDYTSGGSLREGGGTRESAATDSLVQAVPDANGMKFVPIEQDSSEQMTAARAEARRLNSELAPIINNTLKAGAHLEGRSDYGNLWSETAEQFLGGGMAGGDAGDDLTGGDFDSTLEGGSMNDLIANSRLQVTGGTRQDFNPRDGTLNISMDFNASARGGARGTEVIIPDNASPELRAASEKFNSAVAQFARKHGIEDYPVRGVRTRSENGRGVTNTVHVEPFFNDDEDMQKAIQENPEEFARIYMEAFGGVEGRLVNPHGVGKDRGAASPVFGDETSFGELMSKILMGAQS